MAMINAVGHWSTGPVVAGGDIVLRQNWREPFPGHVERLEEIDSGDEVMASQISHFSLVTYRREAPIDHGVYRRRTEVESKLFGHLPECWATGAQKKTGASKH
jgi:hypothetical protein